MSDESRYSVELDAGQLAVLGDIVEAVVNGEMEKPEAVALAQDVGVSEEDLTAAVNDALAAARGDDELEPDVAAGEAGPAFDVEAFVKMLPDGVVLCPHCIGMGAIEEVPPFDPTTHTCEVCRGHGRVRTGSVKTGGDYERDCAACNGTGWQPNDPGVLGLPARASDFSAELPPRDVNGLTPDQEGFDWTRVVPTAAPLADADEPVLEPA